MNKVFSLLNKNEFIHLFIYIRDFWYFESLFFVSSFKNVRTQSVSKESILLFSYYVFSFIIICFEVLVICKKHGVFGRNSFVFQFICDSLFYEILVFRLFFFFVNWRSTIFCFVLFFGECRVILFIGSILYPFYKLMVM